MALGKLNRLHLLLDLYETVHIPRAVYREVIVAGTALGAPPPGPTSGSARGSAGRFWTS